MVIGTFHLSTKLAVLSCLLLQLLRCTTRSGARATNGSCVCRNEGFGWNESSRWPRTGGIRRWDCQWYVVRDGPVKAAGGSRRSGAEETRTPDPLLAKEVLYKLSYGPEAAAPLRGGQSG